ncbi:MAG TPA: DUF3500 domain-containing protein [Planctomycetota bacterium]|nr:DUF3500 domain-containing protein [Planctomycetota bacterium]
MPILRRLPFLAALALALSVTLRAHEGHDAEVQKISRDMADAATYFLNALTDEQRAKATYELKNDERLNWHFIPKTRNGVSLKEMTQSQRALAQALLASGLSARGYISAVTISTLEDILHQQEQGKGPKRDSELYFVTVFGKPGPDATWGWRYEGHHLSLNFTIIAGKYVIGAPSFMGSNPENILDGPRKGQRTLGEVEDAGRKLILALTDEQKKKAIFQAECPKDIFTAAARKVSLAGNVGLPVSEMTAPQKEILLALIKEYAGRLRPELAASEIAKIEKAGLDKIYFAWAGETELKKAHYYRVHGPTFLIEYDNIQNGANHVHSVWRDLENDFGEDLLKKHYAESHAGQK